LHLAKVLLFRAGTRLCAIAVAHVEEAMRPLPCEPLPGLPPFVRGVSIVRGRPTPIVDLRVLLGDHEPSSPRRLVILRTDGARRVGLLVDEVLGIRGDQGLSAGDLPPLLADAATAIVESLARLDGELLTVLRTGSLVPAEVWSQVPEAPS
jgi:purine-binding chemotaxis protein CheW